MKLSLVLATVALAVPGLAGTVMAVPENTAVFNQAHRRPFMPLSKNGTAHGLVNVTGTAIPTGGPVRGIRPPFADNPIQTLSHSKNVAAASMTAGAVSQATADPQVPNNPVKGKRDTFKKTTQKNGGNNGHQERTGTDKKTSTAPHKINALPADFGTKSAGVNKPWVRPSADGDKGKSKHSSAGLPKNAGRKFKEALASTKAKAEVSFQAPWTKKVDHGKGNTPTSQSNGKAKKTRNPRRSLSTATDTSNKNHRRSDTPFGIKKGICYKEGVVAPSFSRDGSATWAYNWGASPAAPMFQQIPMFWGPRDHGDSAGVMERVREGAPWVLGYNEPDMLGGDAGGCNASPREAYDAWGIDMFPFYEEGAKLVCPAITSNNATQGATGGPSGLVWLREFVGYTTKPTDLLCGAQALHWYGDVNFDGRKQAELFISYVAQAHDEINALFGFEMPLWITEFAPLPNDNPVVMAEFLDVALPWLDGQAYVERYSPYMADKMVDDAHQLNVAGQKFVTWQGGAN